MLLLVCKPTKFAYNNLKFNFKLFGLRVKRCIEEGLKGNLRFPLHKKQVRNHNKHNDVRKKEQEPRNRFIPILAKQIENPSPEQNVENLKYKN